MTSRTRRDAEQKEADLIIARDEGMRVQALFEDPVVTDFWTAMRAQIVEQMIAAPVGDDDARRNCAHMVKAFDNLKKHIETKIGHARRAATALEEDKQ